MPTAGSALFCFILLGWKPARPRIAGGCYGLVYVLVDGGCYDRVRARSADGVYGVYHPKN